MGLVERDWCTGGGGGGGNCCFTEEVFEEFVPGYGDAQEVLKL